MAVFSINEKIISFKKTYNTTKYSLRYILKVKDGMADSCDAQNDVWRLFGFSHCG